MAGNLGGELVVTHEIPAHELAGWVQVREEFEDRDSPFVIAAVAYGRAGDEGAAFGYEDLTRPPDTRLLPYVTGLGPHVALTVSGQPTQRRLSPDLKTVPGWRTNDRRVEFGEGFYREDRPMPYKGVWTFGNDALVDAIKYQLAEHCAEEFYPSIYYLLAQMCAEGDQLVDPSMHEMTLIEKSLSDYRYKSLIDISSTDWKLQTTLQDYSAGRHSRIIKDFVASRRSVAQREIDISEAMTFSVYSGARIHLPVGYGKGGRTWPFMDPTAESEEKAFGKEVELLKGHNYGSAIRQTAAEITELHYRIENARDMAGRLAILSAKEAAMLDARAE
jgi:hypothetical protein